MLCTRSLWILCAPLVPAPQTAEDVQQEPRAELVLPAERQPIAGLNGIALTSKLKSIDPDGVEQEQDLKLWFTFPDRARQAVAPVQARRGERALLYRYGPQTWRVEKGEPASQRLDGAAALQVELEFELRRALWLWPDGFHWSDSGQRRSAPVTVPSATESGAWFLVARLGEDGRPLEMGLAQGTAIANERAGPSFRSVSWKAKGERFFPIAMEFFRGDQRQWSEVVTATFPATQTLEHFFLPPDRKSADTPVRTMGPRDVRLPARAEFRLALEADTSWEVALASARTLAEAQRESLKLTGLKIAPTLIVELDGEAAPRAVLLELEQVPDELPDGWKLTPESAALDLRLPGEGPVPAARLTELRARLRPTDRPDWPFVRIGADPRGATRRQLLLPYER